MQQYADIYLLQRHCDFAVNKYLHTVASGWIFINIEVVLLFFLGDCLLYWLDWNPIQPGKQSVT